MGKLKIAPRKEKFFFSIYPKFQAIVQMKSYQIRFLDSLISVDLEAINQCCRHFVERLFPKERRLVRLILVGDSQAYLTKLKLVKIHQRFFGYHLKGTGRLNVAQNERLINLKESRKGFFQFNTQKFNLQMNMLVDILRRKSQQRNDN